MEASKYGLERRTCSVTHHLEVVAVAGLLWISRCVLGAAGFRIFFPIFFFKDRTRPAASMRPPCPIFLATSNEAVFAFGAKEPLHTGVRTGCHYLISLSVRLSVCMCNICCF